MSQNRPKHKTSASAPRRLFSLESLRNAAAGSSGTNASSTSSSTRSRSEHSRNQTALSHVDEEQNEDPLKTPAPTRSWFLVQSTDAPENNESALMMTSPTQIEPESDGLIIGAGTRSAHDRNASIESTQERLPQSRIHWNNLRQHVLPSIPSSSRPAHSPASAVTVAGTNASQSMQPSRSTTPKPFRFQKIGLRGIVETAMTVDGSRKFAQEILRLCWSIRYGDLANSLQKKSDRDHTYTSTAASNLAAFAAGSTLGLAGFSAGSRKHQNDGKGPQSSSSSLLLLSQIASLKAMKQLLLQQAMAVDHTAVSALPHESLVISTLLVPLMNQHASEEEQTLVFELFEIVVKNWSTASEEAAVERCVWACLSAAYVSRTSIRTRALRVLSNLITSPAERVQVTIPSALDSLLQALLTLFAALAVSLENSREAEAVRDLVSQVQRGVCGELDRNAFETLYNATFQDDDSDEDVMRHLTVISLLSCIDSASQAGRFAYLGNVLEMYWPISDPNSTPSALVASIINRCLLKFSRTAMDILRHPSPQGFSIIMRLMRTRIVPESILIRGSTPPRTLESTARVLLELISCNQGEQITNFAAQKLGSWYTGSDKTKQGFRNALKAIIDNDTWPLILRTCSALARLLSDEVRKPVFGLILPALLERLSIDAPSYPCLPLTDLFESLSHLYPQLFFKPLFACAVSSNDIVVGNQLSNLNIMRFYLRDLWTRNAEMVSAALMSNDATKPQGGEAATTEPAQQRTWGKTRLGQSVVMVEVIASIREARKADQVTDDMVKFCASLELRMAALLEFKERTMLVPLSQRLLFCVLFIEIRLLTRSLKTSPWVSRVISWVAQAASGGPADEEDVLAETDMAIEQLKSVYVTVQNASRTTEKHRTTMLFSPRAVESSSTSSDPLAPQLSAIKEREQLISKWGTSFVAKALELLVTVSSMLGTEDFERIAKYLWGTYIHEFNSAIVAPAACLIMQAAEVIPAQMTDIIHQDASNSASDNRLQAITAISTLFNWRFQLRTQSMILDRTHRRPFRAARATLPYVATDIGSSQFVVTESLADADDALPLELRKRLADIGWAQEERTTDQRNEWIHTPFSILPITHMDRFPATVEHPHTPLSSSPLASPALSPSASPSGASVMESVNYLRRKTSDSGAAVKRRPVFVPAMTTLLTELVTLLSDSDLAVSAFARNVFLDIMRNEPSLLTRPIFDLFSEEHHKVDIAMTVFRGLLHVKESLPPVFTHNVFNTLAGFLKHMQRHVDSQEPLRAFAYSIPILGQLAPQLQGMTIRDIRKNKIDMFLIPSGALWFPMTAPDVPMFPKGLELSESMSRVPQSLIWITMIRLAQNHMFLNVLKQNPQEIQVIRKTMSRLVLPSLENSEPLPLDLEDFIPRKSQSRSVLSMSLQSGVDGFSMLISRSYVLLTAQIFRAMPRHLSDRNELMTLLEGINRILISHGDDIGIVGQCMITLLVASTKFRRLFKTGNGYALFMPAIIKVYTESKHPGIRAAIEFAVNRFNALQPDAFQFQVLDVMAPMFSLDEVDHDWLAKNIFDLFSSLSHRISSDALDHAGIRDANKAEEANAILVNTAEEKPQLFLASFERGNGLQREQPTDPMPKEYDTKVLYMDNFVRLFLTVIAHNPTIMRAHHFLRFLRYLVPYLYNAEKSTPVNQVLRDGVDALGTVLMKAGTKIKTTDNAPTSSVNSSETIDQELKDQFKTSTSSDLLTMKIDYLSLVAAYTTAGGKLPGSTHERLMELVKGILKETSRHNTHIGDFFTTYTKSMFLRDEISKRYVTSFLRELDVIARAYNSTIDFGGVFNCFAKFLDRPEYADDRGLVRLIIGFCAPFLQVALSAQSTPLIGSSWRTALVAVMVKPACLREDVVAIIEVIDPTYDFLMGIVLPFLLDMPLSTQIVPLGQKRLDVYRQVCCQTWMRILYYAMTICRQRDRPPSAPNNERGSIRDNSQRRSSKFTGKERTRTVVGCLQIAKVVIVRAQDDLLATSLGVWTHLADFFREVLHPGNANFAFGTHSPSVSPSQSPRPSMSSSDDGQDPFADPSGMKLNASPAANPRLVDYSLWSLLELLVRYRSPLSIHLRLLVQEKVAELDQDLRMHLGLAGSSLGGSAGPAGGGPRRQSVARPMSVYSIFVKPRRRSGVPSSQPSTPISPTFQLHHHHQQRGLGITTLDDPTARKPGYQIASSPQKDSNAAASGGANNNVPKITHLGPVDLSTAASAHLISSALHLHHNQAAAGGPSQSLSRTATVKSQNLVVQTYTRIRYVQRNLGYPLLLPFPPGTDGGAEGAIEGSDEVGGGGGSIVIGKENPAGGVWTRRQALSAVVEETQELTLEFIIDRTTQAQAQTHGEEDATLADADQTVTFS